MLQYKPENRAKSLLIRASLVTNPCLLVGNVYRLGDCVPVGPEVQIMPVRKIPGGIAGRRISSRP